MDANKDEMLFNFQAISGMDIGECLGILESHNWDWMSATQSVIGMQDFSSNTEPVSQLAVPTDSQSEPSLPSQPTDLSIEGSSVAPSSSAPPPRRRLLTFHVEYRDCEVPVVLLDSEPVGRIKEILCRELNISADAMELKGFGKHKTAADTVILRELNLPLDNRIFLLTPSLSTNITNTTFSPNPKLMSAAQNYELRIAYSTGSEEKPYTIKFPGSKTIADVKTDMNCLIGVPVRRQLWSGWPSVSDTTQLCEAGLTEPHELSVREKEQSPAPKASVVQTLSSDESDMEIWEEPSDTILDTDWISEPKGSCQDPLLPERIESEEECLQYFSRVFAARYGETHPCFYIGSLEDCVRDSLQCPAASRKPLCVYLHHDGSIQTNIFCQTVLCAAPIVEFLALNTLVWGWDLTRESSRARLLTSFTRLFGLVAAEAVRHLKVSSLPALVVISRSRGSFEVTTMINGNCGLDEVLTQLTHACEVFEQQRVMDEQEEQERNLRNAVKHEQDRAYQESLAADKAKAARKKEEEEEKRLLEEALAAQVENEERRKQEEADRKEREREELVKQLPVEPKADSTAPMARLRFRCPDGSMLQRRFLATDSLRVLKMYAIVNHFPCDQYKLLTSFPRRDLLELENEDLSLEELKLCPQETLTVVAKQ